MPRASPAFAALHATRPPRVSPAPCLLCGPRVAVQLALLLRNICQFDFPGQWQGPIDALVMASGCQDPASGAQIAPERALRALKALKHVLRGLQSKRFVAEGQPPGTRA